MVGIKGCVCVKVKRVNVCVCVWGRWCGEEAVGGGEKGEGKMLWGWGGGGGVSHRKVVEKCQAMLGGRKELSVPAGGGGGGGKG